MQTTRCCHFILWLHRKIWDGWSCCCCRTDLLVLFLCLGFAIRPDGFLIWGAQVRAAGRAALCCTLLLPLHQDFILQILKITHKKPQIYQRNTCRTLTLWPKKWLHSSNDYSQSSFISEKSFLNHQSSRNISSNHWSRLTFNFHTSTQSFNHHLKIADFIILSDLPEFCTLSRLLKCGELICNPSHHQSTSLFQELARHQRASHLLKYNNSRVPQQQQHREF